MSNMKTVVAALIVVVLLVALTLISSESFPYAAVQTNVKNRNGLGWRAQPNGGTYPRGNYDVVFGEHGNLVYYPAVDPNLLQTAGSGELY